MKKKNYTGITIATIVLFFPLGLYFMWAKTKWNKVIKWIITSVYALFTFIMIAGIASTPTTNTTGTTASQQTVTKQEVTQVSAKPTAVPIPTVAFDKSKGNNQVAAEQAQRIISAFASSTPGLVKDVYVSLDPQDMGGKSETEYEKSVLQDAQINVVVDGDSWDATDDSLKKDFVVGLIKAIQGNIGVYPSITVSDGIREVAKGSWDVWNGQANVTLE